MNIEKVSFLNENSEKIAGRLELPVNQKPHNFAIFAHCFTCTKNLTAVRNVSRALTMAGFGVLRFDFTGLGESEGDFENTNFSGTVEDLVHAVTFLEKEYASPTLLIGHSLGGTAVLFAAAKLPTVKAIAIINAPHDPKHVKGIFKSNLAEINLKGAATVNLGGQDFTIKKQFLENLESQKLDGLIANLNQSLLVMHSPQDTIVGINNAEEIYKAARHPKSFVSLDGADHLLSNKIDSQYVGEVIAAWALRYIKVEDVQNLKSSSNVVARLHAEDIFTTNLKLGSHTLLADEPVSFGGNNFGPNPYEFVSGGLAACTAMTLLMYARRKKWDLKTVEVHVDYGKQYAIDCENCDDDAAKIDTFSRKIKIEGNLDEKQKSRILQIADKCPVHKTLETKTQIITELLR